MLVSLSPAVYRVTCDVSFALILHIIITSRCRRRVGNSLLTFDLWHLTFADVDFVWWYDCAAFCRDHTYLVRVTYTSLLNRENLYHLLVCIFDITLYFKTKKQFRYAMLCPVKITNHEKNFVPKAKTVVSKKNANQCLISFSVCTMWITASRFSKD